MYPVSFENLILELHKLPGVGMKSAERMAFAILGWDEDQKEQMIQAFKNAANLKHCKICGNLTEGEICEICENSDRNHNQICVVQNEKDLYAIESINEYNGVYHVLHGTINIQKGILPDQLNIDALEDRITDETEEIILALDPTQDGETTSLYLSRLLSDRVLVTKLASGIPFGGKLDYADAKTIAKAFDGRKKDDI